MDISTAIEPHPLCPEHGKALEFFDWTDNRVICSIDMLTRMDHEIQTLADAKHRISRIVRQSTLDQTQLCTLVRERIGETDRLTDACRRHHASTMESIEERFTEIRRIVDQREETIRTTASVACSNQLQSLSEMRDELLSLDKRGRAAAEAAERVMCEGDPYSLACHMLSTHSVASDMASATQGGRGDRGSCDPSCLVRQNVSFLSCLPSIIQADGTVTMYPDLMAKHGIRHLADTGIGSVDSVRTLYKQRVSEMTSMAHTIQAHATAAAGAGTAFANGRKECPPMPALKGICLKTWHSIASEVEGRGRVAADQGRSMHTLAAEWEKDADSATAACTSLSKKADRLVRKHAQRSQRLAMLLGKAQSAEAEMVACGDTIAELGPGAPASADHSRHTRTLEKLTAVYTKARDAYLSERRAYLTKCAVAEGEGRELAAEVEEAELAHLRGMQSRVASYVKCLEEDIRSRYASAIQTQAFIDGLSPVDEVIADYEMVSTSASNASGMAEGSEEWMMMHFPPMDRDMARHVRRQIQRASSLSDGPPTLSPPQVPVTVAESGPNRLDMPPDTMGPARPALCVEAMPEADGERERDVAEIEGAEEDAPLPTVPGVAVFDYASEDGAVSMTHGQPLSIVTHDPEGWSLVILQEGAEPCYVPGTFIALEGADDTHNTAPVPTTDSPLPPVPFSVSVLYSREAEGEDELGIVEGQTVSVIEVFEEGGWYMARDAEGKEGLIPDNYVTLQ
ncbi:hypothetical protein KIPB_005765 [Kipferlia bialata]|uniref:SH3 domain-containing protein n=1 Tax=Kipferlia bialata TaxID=797122 RepID=A0A9K3CWI8_9EUKA|nr:hypothetical protein KIPB_005765 [Kipferlia bialata]|eukprot:g5765.t1